MGKESSFGRKKETIAVIACANSKGSGEPAHPPHRIARTYAFTRVSGRPKDNFSQRTRCMASLRGRVCALKDAFDAAHS